MSKQGITYVAYNNVTGAVALMIDGMMTEWLPYKSPVGFFCCVIGLNYYANGPVYQSEVCSAFISGEGMHRLIMKSTGNAITQLLAAGPPL